MEKAWDISTAVTPIKVSEQAILHSTNLYRLPSTAQPHSELFTSLLVHCLLLKIIKKNQQNTTFQDKSGARPHAKHG
jgi:hypothetical protein